MPQGSSRTVIGPSFAALTENRPWRRAGSSDRRRRRGPRRRVGQAVQLAMAVVDVAVESSRELPPRPGLRLEEQPAEHPGRRDGLAVRAEDPGGHRRAAAEDDVDLPAVGAGLEVAGDRRRGRTSEPRPAGPRRASARRSPGARSPRWGPGRTACPGWAGPRAGTSRPGPSAWAPGAGRVGPVRPPEIAERRPGDGPARAFLDDLAAEHRAPAQGEVDRCSTAPLGHANCFRAIRYGAPSRDLGLNRETTELRTRAGTTAVRNRPSPSALGTGRTGRTVTRA